MADAEINKMLFDESYYLKINEARWTVAIKVLHEIRYNNGQELRNCIDAGCGPGWFTKNLADSGLSVIGVEGRRELVEEARLRTPEAIFYHIDVESKAQMAGLPKADLVFCFGLLYHLENPFRAIRNLYHLTNKVLFIETMLIPDNNPIMWLVEEGRNETQGLTYHAMIPTRTCLVKMLQCAGFEYIYEYIGEVDHDDFIETEEKYKRREIFIASKLKLDLSGCVLAEEIVTPKFNFARNQRSLV